MRANRVRTVKVAALSDGTRRFGSPGAISDYSYDTHRTRPKVQTHQFF